MITERELVRMGFLQVAPHNTTRVWVRELGRDRYLLLGDVGSPNEMLFICEGALDQTPSDAVCLHNFDFEGPLTTQKIEEFLALLLPEGTNLSVLRDSNPRPSAPKADALPD